MSSEQNRAAKQVTETLSYFLTRLSAYSTTAANKESLISNNLHRFAPPPCHISSLTNCIKNTPRHRNAAAGSERSAAALFCID